MADWDVARLQTIGLAPAILAHIRAMPVCATAQEIAAAVRAPLADVQAELHALDDAGCVVMRNGFYRLSAAETARGAA